MISILFPSTLSIEASCSQGIILGDYLMLSEFKFFGDQLKGTTGTSHDSNLS